MTFISLRLANIKLQTSDEADQSASRNIDETNSSKELSMQTEPESTYVVGSMNAMDERTASLFAQGPTPGQVHLNVKRSLNPNDYPVVIYKNSSEAESYQCLIWWKDCYRFTFDQCGKLWINAGYCKNRDGTVKDRISLQGVAKNYHNHYKVYYKERGIPVPDEKSNKPRQGSKSKVEPAPSQDGLSVEVDREAQVERASIGNLQNPNGSAINLDDERAEYPSQEQQERSSFPRGRYRHYVGEQFDSQSKIGPNPTDVEETSEIALKQEGEEEIQFRETLRGREIAFYFKNEHGGAIPDNEPPMLDAAIAAEHSKVLRGMLRSNPDTKAVLIDSQHMPSTMRFFITCITVCLNLSPPQPPVNMNGWDAMPLYFLASDLGCEKVMDMITDHYHSLAMRGFISIHNETLNRIADIGDTKFLDFWIDALGLMRRRWMEIYKYPRPSDWWYAKMRNAPPGQRHGPIRDGSIGVVSGSQFAICRRYHRHDPMKGEPCYRQYEEVKLNREKQSRIDALSNLHRLDKEIKHAGSLAVANATLHRTDEVLKDATQYGPAAEMERSPSVAVLQDDLQNSYEAHFSSTTPHVAQSGQRPDIALAEAMRQRYESKLNKV